MPHFPLERKGRRGPNLHMALFEHVFIVMMVAGPVTMWTRGGDGYDPRLTGREAP